MRSCLLASVVVGLWQVPSPGAAMPETRADYRMQVRFDPATRVVEGRAEVSYAPVPDTLHSLALHLYPNAYRAGTALDRMRFREGQRSLANFPGQDLGECRVESVQVLGHQSSWEPAGDLGWIRLDPPAVPGESLLVNWKFRTQLPANLGRGAIGSREAWVCEWYPKLAEWEAGRWLEHSWDGRGEFYSDFGRYEVSLTLPRAWELLHPGELKNAGEVLSPQRRVAWAGLGERPVRLPRFTSGDSLTAWVTWEVRADSIHDFAFAAGADWNTVALRDHGVDVKVVASRFTGVNLDSVAVWSAAMLRDCSQRFGEYPYRDYSVGIARGLPTSLEKPRMAWLALSQVRAGGGLYLIPTLAHEIAHGWFFGVVASNEWQHPWMDEGPATYYAMLQAARHPRDFSQEPYDDELLRADADWCREGAPETALQPAADFRSTLAYARASYLRPALLLQELARRNGEARVSQSLGDYTRRWQFRHPTPDALLASLRGIRGSDSGLVGELLKGGRPAADYREPAGGLGMPVRLNVSPWLPTPRSMQGPGLAITPTAGYCDADGFSGGARLTLEEPAGRRTFNLELRLPVQRARSGYAPTWGATYRGHLRLSPVSRMAFEVGSLSSEGRDRQAISSALHWSASAPAAAAGRAWITGERWVLREPAYLRRPGSFAQGRELALELGWEQGLETRGATDASLRFRAGGTESATFASVEGGARLVGASGSPWQLESRWGWQTPGAAQIPQEHFRAGSGGPRSEWELSWARSGGILRPGSALVTRWGAGASGYADREVQGRGYLSLRAQALLPGSRNLQLPAPWQPGQRVRVSPSIFSDLVALSDGSWTNALGFADAGLQLRLLPGFRAPELSLEFPLWVSRPPAEESALGVRWALRIRGLGRL